MNEQQVHVDAEAGVAQAVVGGSKIFVSSVTPPAAAASAGGGGGGGGGDVAAQTDACLAHLETVLAACGSSLAHASKFDAYVATDADAAAATAAIAARVVSASSGAVHPAVSCVCSAAMPTDTTFVQLACIAQTTASRRSYGVSVGRAAGGGGGGGGGGEGQVAATSDAAVQDDGTVFVSVQGAPAAAEEEPIGDETARVCARLREVVASSGHTLNDVAKVNIYMQSMGDYAEINKVGTWVGARKRKQTTMG
jgi:enamine deaminase RidA (YjgF/YER057c/UK114 family)